MQPKSRGFQYWGYLLVGALVFAVYLFIRTKGPETVLKAVLGEPGKLINEAMNSARVSPE